MNLAAISALLPVLFWTQGPKSAPLLAHNNIVRIAVPAGQLSAWKQQTSIAVEGVDPDSYEKLPSPGVSFRSNVASATREPWVDSDGWHFLRKPEGHFIYNVPGPNAALAAAEAFTFSGDALIQTDDAGLPALAHMLEFLDGLPKENLHAVADIRFDDDGSPMASECLNLLIRRNLLVQVKQQPSAPYVLNVVLGSSDYPRKDAANPVVFAQEVRQHLTDSRRSLRLYGSNVVIGRLESNGARSRILLLNYGTGKYLIEGIRVRVLGHYAKATLVDSDNSNERPLDPLFTPEAAELTVQNLKTFAVIDLYQ